MDREEGSRGLSLWGSRPREEQGCPGTEESGARAAGRPMFWLRKESWVRKGDRPFPSFGIGSAGRGSEGPVTGRTGPPGTQERRVWVWGSDPAERRVWWGRDPVERRVWWGRDPAERRVWWWG